MTVPAGMVARVLTEPALFEPRTSQPPTSTGEEDKLYNSMNSSAAPFGPRTRNSLITMDVELALAKFMGRPEIAKARIIIAENILAKCLFMLFSSS